MEKCKTHISLKVQSSLKKVLQFPKRDFLSFDLTYNFHYLDLNLTADAH